MSPREPNVERRLSQVEEGLAHLHRDILELRERIARIERPDTAPSTKPSETSQPDW